MNSGLVDSTSGVSNGTVQGATAVAGRIGTSYSFNGTSSYLDLGNAAELNLTNTLSVEAWFRVGSTTRNAYDRIVSKKSVWDAAGGFNLEVQPSLGYLGALGGGADYLRATGVIFDTQWHYAASSASGSSGSLYLDGRNVTTDATLGSVTTSTVPVNVGRASGGDYFLGDIDEVRLSAVARAAGWFAAQNASMRDQLFTYGATQQAQGLSATASLVLLPRTVDVAFQTEPPGLGLSVGSQSVAPPYFKTVINGGQLSVSAPLTQTLGGQSYVFSHWSEGGAADHALTVVSGMGAVVASYALAGGTCSDNIQNGDETGIDCGGPCPACPPICGNLSCETFESCNSCAVDCGACPTCTDGVRNGNETGVDCGGSCLACPVRSNAVWVEAEAGVRTGNPTFQAVSDSAASGSSALQATANSVNSAGTSRATFSFDVAAGTYALWARVRAPTADDDSFWVSVDGGAFVKWNEIARSTSYVWDRVRNSDGGNSVVNYTLSAGTHTIVIANREDGVRLDKLYLTANGDTPSGVGGGTGTCNDGIQNQTETGIDCGGSCAACTAPNAVWLEAESGARSGNPTFQLVSNTSASGGSAIQASATSSNSAGVNRATFSVNVAAGSYALWGRVRTPTADDDSFWVSVDGSAFVKWNNIPLSTSFVWNRVRNSDSMEALVTYTLSAGTHSIVVANREDGTQLDKLYLTARGDTPSGLGQ
jgi:SH3-like domain-containing protein